MRTGMIALSLWFSFAVAAPLSYGAEAGNTLYAERCQGCHGADGKGNPAIAKVIGEKGLNIVGKETAEKSDNQLLKTIDEGSGKMPPSKLSKQQQKEVLRYVRSLHK